MKMEKLRRRERKYKNIDCRIGWFTTGRDAEAVNLLETIYKGTMDGSIEGRISYIFMNRELGEGNFSDKIIDMSHKWRIPLICFSSNMYEPRLRRMGRDCRNTLMKWRKKYHQEVLKKLDGLEADFSVLAGYMLIVSPDMCHKFTLINLHPAPPNGPAGSWQEVIWQLICMRSYESGVMIHIVTPELDKGPPITYCLYRIRGGIFSALWKEMDEKCRKISFDAIKDQEGERNALFQMIRTEGVKRELPLLVETIRFLCCGRIRILKGKIHLDDKEISGGVCLNEQVERAIANNFNL